MPDPSLTVLMTVYNGGTYLKSSIKSVLRQTFQDFELLIVDDASRDDSLKIAQSFGETRIVIHSSAHNLGQTKSLNIGLKLAKGKYIARMDADDLVFPQWLEELSAFLDKNNEVAVVSAKAVVVTQRAGVTRILNTPARWEEMILKSLTFPPINHVGSMMRKDVVLAMGGYDEDYQVPADFHLWSRLIRQGHRLAVVPKILVAIRFHDDNQSKVKNFRQIQSIIRDNVRHLTSYSLEEEETVLLYQLIYEISSLDRREFQEAMKVLENVYAQVKPSLGAEAFIEKSLAAQKRTLTMKMVFSCIDKGDLEGVRILSRDYMQKQGWSNVFWLVWLISFGGTVLLRFLPRVYEQTGRLKMQWALRDQAILREEIYG